MALFKMNYNKPGPGVPKNAPKKKGIKRFFEILGRSFADLVKLNLLQALCFLPAQLLFSMSLFSLVDGNGFWFLIFGVAALLASFLVGPALAAQGSLLTKMLRDDPGHFWHDFKKAFKDNFRSTIVPGMVYALIMGLQLMAGVFYLYIYEETNILMLALFFISLLLFAMAAPYYFIQTVYLDLKGLPKLKNSLLLALGNAPRSMAGAVIWLACMVGQLAFFQYLLVLTLFVGYTFPALIQTMWVWPPIDKTFKISETLKAREAAKLDEALAEPDVAPAENDNRALQGNE